MHVYGTHPMHVLPRLTGHTCECTACRERFSGERAFDAHRVGPYAANGRHCLTPPEMVAAGLAVNPRGHWAPSGAVANPAHL